MSTPASEKLKPVFFRDQNAFRKWLEKNHKTKAELLVGFYKVSTGKPSMTWSESVDQALCFGWIDGVRKSIDEKSYQIRFTPRKPGSVWSAVNVKKVEALTKSGQMTEAGLEAFKKLQENKSKIYSYEKSPARLSAEYEKLFRRNKAAWNYFQELAPSYRKASINWVMTAKQENTRLKRLHILISESAAGTNQWKNSKYSGK